jgi:ketosteroid isomerase-like protein
MSQENVDQFMKAVDAMNRADIPGALGFMDPEIRFEHRLDALQGDYTGIEGVSGFFNDFAEHFEAWQIDCPDVRDLGNRVLALGSVHATGKGSGAETELPFTVVAAFREGRLTHYIDFGDRDQALEAAGLSE